jgi:hypothetical protein
MRKVGDLFFSLLMRFELRGADVAIGIAGTFYGVGCALDCVAGHALAGQCSPAIALLYGIVGVATQFAAAHLRARWRLIVLSINVPLWVYKAIDVGSSLPMRTQGIYWALAIAAMIASARAGASARLDKLHPYRRATEEFGG